jgi:hypothetical protein
MFSIKKRRLSDMEWIKIKDAAKLTNKPERTLRHQAILGRLKSKKDGKDWLINFNSLKEKGFIPTPTKTEAPGLQKNSLLDPLGIPKKSIVNEAKLPIKETKQKIRKSIFELKSLGVYGELLETHAKINQLENLNEEIKLKIVNRVEQALFLIAMGFYEYKFSLKYENYNKALYELAKLVVLFHLGSSGSNGSQDLSLILDKILSVISGVKGLLRKTEMRWNEKRARPQDFVKT